MASEYYSLPEAAAIIGISRIGVYKRVRSGKLSAIRIGRSWAVPAAALAQAPGRGHRNKTIKPISDIESIGWD